MCGIPQLDILGDEAFPEHELRKPPGTSKTKAKELRKTASVYIVRATFYGVPTEGRNNPLKRIYAERLCSTCLNVSIPFYQVEINGLP
jgi:hypothetical protein